LAVEALVLTGPLGAGKTTFLARSLLPALAGRRVVVLVNDAGGFPVDARLLEPVVATIGVADGCFCCHAGGRLLEALAEIRDRLAPDLLILEGSGVSPPDPLVAALTGEGYVHVGTLAVVAADQLARLDRDPVLRAQLGSAGAVVLTRADRLDRAGLEAARGRLAGLARGPIVPAFEGRVRAELAPLLAPGAAPVGRRGAGHGHVRSTTLRPRGLPRRRDLAAWLGAAPETVLRVKGLVQCAEHASTLAVNHSLGESDLRPIAAAAEPGLWIAYDGSEPEAWLARFPEGLDPADWAGLEPLVEPLGEADARPGAAFLDGRPAEAVEAAEVFLTRLEAARRPRLVTSAAAVETVRLWQPVVASIRAIADARLGTLARTLEDAGADLLLLAGLPDGFAERIAREARGVPTLHLARRTAVAAPGASLRVEPQQERALATLAGAAPAGPAG
jgi:G3E family GTPase